MALLVGCVFVVTHGGRGVAACHRGASIVVSLAFRCPRLVGEGVGTPEGVPGVGV